MGVVIAVIGIAAFVLTIRFVAKAILHRRRRRFRSYRFVPQEGPYDCTQITGSSNITYLPPLIAANSGHSGGGNTGSSCASSGCG
jgi:hypothetical protein